MNASFWKDKKVLITGHTGFKGSWISLWLHHMGAVITGYALKPPTVPSLYELCKIERLVHSIIGDIRNRKILTKTLVQSQPEIVFHMAAQPLVRESYRNPVETYEINVMGVVNLLDAARSCKSVKVIINITSDKCYENKEWLWGYRENERLGGHDPYSSSKACSELVTSSYRNSFFNPKDYNIHGIGVSTTRSGNVIGGGDWAEDRLIPDCIRALLKNEAILIRNPRAIRPWQYVLEPLRGYLLLAQKMYNNGDEFSGAWNFGPDDSDAKSVEWIAGEMCRQWGDNARYKSISMDDLPEAQYLKLDCSKAKTKLGWHPRWTIEKAIQVITEWTKAFRKGHSVLDITMDQIIQYQTEAEKSIIRSCQ